MEKRGPIRSEIPGTFVQFRKLKKMKFFSALSKPVEVSNLSKSGICFSSDHPLGSGEPIAMKVIFPDGRKVNLKGHIRWNKELNTNNSYITGVQFYPFGTTGSYNSLKALDVLRSIDGQSVFRREAEDLKENPA